MDHVVYVDAKSQELEKLHNGSKTMIIRGATGRKLPYGRVNPGDILYFINNNAEGTVQAKATVTEVINSEKLDETASAKMVADHQTNLNLSSEQIKRWSGKRYLVLITVSDAEKVQPFPINKSNYGNMDDWLPVEDINTVKIN